MALKLLKLLAVGLAESTPDEHHVPQFSATLRFCSSLKTPKMAAMKKRKRGPRQADKWETVSVRIPICDAPDKVRSAFQQAIDLVKRYELPCDVIMSDLGEPTLAAQGWRKDGTCSILLSRKLVLNGDAKSVHRRVIHEAAHHIAGRGHRHDEHFNRICSEMYEREGYPRGERGKDWGNV
jgi:hypothetical protein